MRPKAIRVGWVARTEFVPEAFALKGEELAETTALMFGRRKL